MTWPWMAALLSLWIFVLILGLLLLGLLRRVSSFLEGAESRLRGSGIPPDFGGLTPGSLVPGFQLRDSEGRRLGSSEVVLSPMLLLFADPGCEPCEDLLRLMDGSDGQIDGVPYLIVAEDPSETPGFPVPPGARVLYQSGKDVSALFQNIATPQAFAIRRSIVVGKTIPQSVEDLKRLAALVGEGGDLHNLEVDQSVKVIG